MAFIEWLHRGRLPRELVGGKAASLSEMLSAGFAVPLGYAVNADGYRCFEEAAGIEAAAEGAAGLDPKDLAAVRAFSEKVTTAVMSADLPDELREQVAAAYDELVSMSGVASAVRSSAVSEDGAGASFAGLYESYLNVLGVNGVLDSLKRCYASLWSERAIRYRALKGMPIGGEAMAVVVMGLVPSEKSGIAFTAHPVTGDRDRVVINASYGLGEAIVSGRVTPDAFVVHKESLGLLEREIYEKCLAIFPHPDGGGTIERELEPGRANAPSISDEEAKAVARIALQVEEHFGSPQDVEWGMAAGQIYLLQSRPITTL
ncbi:MAG TPA: PEP/pyruvate-binding domain-containing protein [Dehalococcoidia bacterium]|nr:PEP/pyruvate-binding domain-containing protein [Dehalococcoidia bacterium]